jgi:hypothetical protein
VEEKKKTGLIGMHYSSSSTSFIALRTETEEELLGGGNEREGGKTS